MEIKDKILKELKKEKLSTSRVASLLRIDYNYATKLLEELLLEKSINKIDVGVATYWEIK